MAFRSFEPRIREPFPNEQLLRKKKIAATEQTIFHWETAVQFTVQKIGMPCSMSVAKVTEYVHLRIAHETKEDEFQNEQVYVNFLIR